MSLECRLRPAAGEAQGALVLFHGRGADENDLYPLLDFLDPERRLVAATPRGPLSLPPGGAHWYIVREIGFPDRETFEASYRLAGEFLAAFAEETGVPPELTVLGGFSQGAVMTYALSLGRGRPRPAALIALSGFIPTVEGFEVDLSPPLPPVAIGHGTYDPVISVEWSRRGSERRLPQHRESRRAREAERVADHERFAENVDHADERRVGDELGRRPRADLADAEDGAEHREQRAPALDELGLPADEDVQGSGLDLRGRAEHRRVEQGVFGEERSEARRGVRADRRHLDHGRPLPHTGRHAVRAFRNVGERLRVGDHRDHRLDPPGDVGGTLRDERACDRERLGLRAVAVPDDEVVTGAGEPPCDAAAHRPQADH